MKSNDSQTALLILIVGSVLVGLFTGGHGRYGDYENTDYAEYMEEEAEYKAYSPSDCTSDCSGHIAGYHWARRNGISSIYQCEGNSESFVQGCMDYAKTQQNEEDPPDDNPQDGLARYAY